MDLEQKALLLHLVSRFSYVNVVAMHNTRCLVYGPGQVTKRLNGPFDCPQGSIHYKLDAVLLVIFRISLTNLTMRPFFSLNQLFLICCACALSAQFSVISGHMVFLRPISYQLDPGETSNIIVLDGTFEESVIAVAETSIDKLQIRSPRRQFKQNLDSWESLEEGSKLWQKSKEISGGSNLNHTSVFEIIPKDEGSHAISLELKAFRVAAYADEFREYLKTELASSLDLGALGFTDDKAIIKERFIKVAKTLIQVGDVPSDQVTKPMNLLMEIVPVTHPVEANVGDTLQFKVLEKRKPRRGQPVFVGRNQGLSPGEEEESIILVSDDKGVISVPITHDGIWWMKFVDIQPAPKRDSVDFVSRWASLTFEIK